MKTLKLGVIGCSVFLLAACPGDDRPAEVDPADPTVTAPPPEEAPMIAPEQAALQEVAGSGVTGQVMATPRQDRTDVAVSVSGAPPNESLGARIQSGTCESPGPELARLDAISTDDMGTGMSETNVGHAPHLILDGNHIAAVYAPGTEPERDMPIACATLPQTMG